MVHARIKSNSIIITFFTYSNTIFSAIILLSLLTLMLLYSSRVQQSETRISANEYRQKLAFHAAESAADQVLADNPEMAERYRGGDTKVLNFLMGQVMKRTQGKASPPLVREILARKLEG